MLILCGIGIPLPEEVVLVYGGYMLYKGFAAAVPIGLACSGAILIGDSIPFALGRLFGPKLLRLRIVRSYITQKRLANFDKWFQRHGRLTIFVARFLTGIRMPAYFAAGSMRTSIARFVAMDGLGVLIMVPPFIALGWWAGDHIDSVAAWIQTLERGIGITILVSAAAGLGVYLWIRRRHSKRALGEEVPETFVGPPPLPNDPTAPEEAVDPAVDPGPEPLNSLNTGDGDSASVEPPMEHR